MSFQNERSAIEARFADNWTGTSADRVKYENLPFNQPKSGAWVALTIRDGMAQQASISSRPLNRYPGIIVVDIFVAENTGTDEARRLADLAADIFRNVQFSAGSSGTITTRVPYVTAVPPRNGWFQLSVTANFYRDKVD